MMTPPSLYALLTANAALAALVGTRIYPSQGPQDAGSAGSFIIWTRIASQPFSTHGEVTGNQFDTVQFSCFAPTFEEADDIKLALIAALDGVTLSTGDTATLQSSRDAGFEPAISMHRSDSDFLI